MVSISPKVATYRLQISAFLWRARHIGLAVETKTRDVHATPDRSVPRNPYTRSYRSQEELEQQLLDLNAVCGAEEQNAKSTNAHDWEKKVIVQLVQC